MLDSYQRKINYARFSITDLCNLRCLYCMPEEGVTKQNCGDILRIEDIITIARVLVEMGVDKIRLTGGEPLVRKGLLTLVEELGSWQELKDLSLTTNGLLLPRLSEDLKRAGLKRVNISLDTLDPEKYAYITRVGALDKVLDGIDTALSVFDKVKLNTVLIKDFNDDEIESFVDLTWRLPVDVRFIELMPFQGQSEFAFGTYLSGDEVLRRCPNLKPVVADDPSAPANLYAYEGALGRVGIIRPMSCKFCENCNRIRISADGELLTCLHACEEVNLRPYLQDKEALRQVITEAITKKPKEHHLMEGQLQERDMGKIGG